ncbi:MAG TPA: ABC transporter ATP-binding protein [Thermoanaerobaculia bacterium]|nr:ABC transporter ATP-binding protein [Thermoanaerobaculia bacterium]
MSLVVAEALTRVYRLGDERVVGVEAASLVLEPAEFTVIAGPSGSGKTTLLNILGLLDTPDSGRLVFDGKETSGISEPERARLRRERLGFVFQTNQLIPVLSAEENVALALWIRDLAEEECRRRARAALVSVGLEGLEGRRPDKLSGGQRQRAAVARAIVGEPALVLADEPTASLDTETATRLLDLFQELHDSKGVGFVFSSHDPRMIERARRRIRLADGKIVADERGPR